MQLEDNVDNVQSYPAGQVVDFHVDIEARHTGEAVSYMDMDLKNLTNMICHSVERLRCRFDKSNCHWSTSLQLACIHQRLTGPSRLAEKRK